MGAPHGLQTEEKLLWKYEQTRHFGFFLWSKSKFSITKVAHIFSAILAYLWRKKASFGFNKSNRAYITYTNAKKDISTKHLVTLFPCFHLNSEQFFNVSMKIDQNHVNPQLFLAKTPPSPLFQSRTTKWPPS